MLSINTNLSSLIAQNSMKTSTNKLNEAIERMSTGYKINHAKDNAANYSISTNLTTRMSAYQVAEDNVAMGIDMVTTADETLSTISDKLSRLRALAVTAQNGTYGTQSLEALKSEAKAITDEIERIKNSAEFNGIKLFGEELVPIINGQKVKTNSAGFIKDVEKVDTTGYTAVSSIIDETQAITGGQYTISSAQDLEKLMRIANNSGTLLTGEFVLTKDIDMSTVDWAEWENGLGQFSFDNSVFNGNGYKVTNAESIVFWGFMNSEVRNLGMEIVDVDNGFNAPITMITNTKLTNCFAKGQISNPAYASAGLVLMAEGGTIDSCWTDVDLVGGGGVAGGILAGLEDVDGDGIYSALTIKNCYTLGEISGFQFAGGIAGLMAGTIEDCYTSSKIGNFEYDDEIHAIIANNSLDPSNPDATNDLIIRNVTYDAKVNLGMDVYGGDLTRLTASGVQGLSSLALDTSFQVGIYGDRNSTIDFKCNFSLEGIDSIADSLLEAESLKKIDSFISSVAEKQTEFGAINNRLESVLEEIGIQYDNLASSRSTIRDADMAELSSTYIQQQILQQTAATLMSTANQSPAIALQLI